MIILYIGGLQRNSTEVSRLIRWYSICIIQITWFRSYNWVKASVLEHSDAPMTQFELFNSTQLIGVTSNNKFISYEKAFTSHSSVSKIQDKNYYLLSNEVCSNYISPAVFLCDFSLDRFFV